MSWIVAIPVVVLLALLVVFAVRSARHGGALGALFKARITRTLGSVEVVNSAAPKLHIKVHALQKSEPGWVGVEFQTFNGDNWRISPLTLSRAEARDLASLLAQAADAT
jgi:hypothetical protein